MSRLSTRVGVLLAMVLAAAPSLGADDPPAAAAASEAPAIQDNMSVEMEYTLTADSQVVDTTEGRGPFKFVQGKGQIIPGLERQLVGLHVGDSKEISVASEEAYGPVDPSAFVEVPKTQLPEKVTPEVGLVLRGVDPDGQQFRARIHEVKDQTVMLDLNHPLAGKALLFKVKILSIAPAS